MQIEKYWNTCIGHEHLKVVPPNNDNEMTLMKKKIYN